MVETWSWTLAWIGALVLLFMTRRRDSRLRPSRAGLAGALAIVALAWAWPLGFGRVQPGARGIVLRFGAPTGRTIGEGLYYVIPLAERVVQVNTQINTIHFDRAQGTCRDLEPVYADLAVTFHVVPSRAIDVYRSLRAQYAGRVITPSVKDAWKATVARYDAADLIVRRPEVEHTLVAEIRQRVEPFGLAIDAVATERFNFSYAYAQAAQEKVASVQRTLQAQQELERVRFESQQSVIRARSEVQALQLQRNIPVQQLVRLRELELESRAIEKWDGHLPPTTGTIPFLGQAIAPSQD